MMSKRWILYGGCALLMVGGGYLLWMGGYRNILSYAMFLLCPLMHLVMHRGHGGHNHEGAGTNPGEAPKSETGKPACH